MGASVGAETVEAFSDEDLSRATGLLTAGAALQADMARDVLRAMFRLRALDAEAQAQSQPDVARIGALPSTRGREAAIVGAVAALAPDDVVSPGRRESGAALWRGAELRALVAQLYGNANDVAVGRQLPGCASFPRSLAVLPATPHAGTQLAQASGVAWAMKMQRKPQVALAYLDAAETSSEDFHTGVNFAGVYRLPVVFVCVTDRTADDLAHETAAETMAVKALAYGVPGVRVDGDDVAAVVDATRAAADRARRGEGPTLIEAVVARGDAVDRFAAAVAEQKSIDAEAVRALDAEAARDVKAAFAAERGVAAPTRRRLIEDVFSRPPSTLEAELEVLEHVRNR
jgi:2-oxoisovalerate dehydrogenase E1 component alpha subunit